MKWNQNYYLQLLLFVLLCFLSSGLIGGCSKSSKPNPKPPVRPELPSEVITGIDALALDRQVFDVDSFIAELPEGKTPVRKLDLTFNESIANTIKLLDSGKVNIFGVHFQNYTCVTNGVCGDYAYGHGHTVQSFNQAIKSNDARILGMFRHRAKMHCDLIDQYPSVRFIFSYALEHQLSEAAYLTLNHVFRKEICDRQDYWIANNPLNAHVLFPQWDLYEQHHHSFRASAFINSLDGEDIDQIDTMVWKQNLANADVKLAFGWAWKMNCRVPGPFVDPRNRTDCPNRDEIRHIIFKTFKDPIPAPQPPPTSANESWGAGNLWKPVSESDGNLVVLIRNQYRDQFDSCKVPLKSGGWEALRFAGYTNPDRQTYRASKNCNRFSERKIVCQRGDFKLTISGGSDACRRAD